MDLGAKGKLAQTGPKKAIKRTGLAHLVPAGRPKGPTPPHEDRDHFYMAHLSVVILVAQVAAELATALAGSTCGRAPPAPAAATRARSDPRARARACGRNARVQRAAPRGPRPAAAPRGGRRTSASSTRPRERSPSTSPRWCRRAAWRRRCSPCDTRGAPTSPTAPTSAAARPRRLERRLRPGPSSTDCNAPDACARTGEGDGTIAACVPAQCPLHALEADAPFGSLPVDPFLAEITAEGKCRCPEPQDCSA